MSSNNCDLIVPAPGAPLQVGDDQPNPGPASRSSRTTDRFGHGPEGMTPGNRCPGSGLIGLYPILRMRETAQVPIDQVGEMPARPALRA